MLFHNTQEGDAEFKKVNIKQASLKVILKKCPPTLFKANCAILSRALECGISTEINWALGRISLITSVLGDLKKLEFAELKKRHAPPMSTTQSFQFKNALLLEEYLKLLSKQTFPSCDFVSRISYHALPFFKVIGIFVEHSDTVHSHLDALISECSKPSSYYFAMGSKSSSQDFCSWALLRYTQILVIFLNLARSEHVAHLSSFANRSAVLLSSLMDGDSKPLLRCWEGLGLSPQPLISLSLMVLELLSHVKIYPSPSFINCLSSIILTSSGTTWMYAVKCFRSEYVEKNVLAKSQIISMLEHSAFIATSSSGNGTERLVALVFIQLLLEHSLVDALSESLLGTLFDRMLHLYLCAIVPLESPSLFLHDMTPQANSLQLSESQCALKFLSLSYEVHQGTSISLKALYSQYLLWLQRNDDETPLPIEDFVPLIREIFPDSILEWKPIACDWGDVCAYTSFLGLEDHFLSAHANENTCGWMNCNHPSFASSKELIEHFYSSHFHSKNTQFLLNLRAKRNNIIPVPLTEMQLELSRQLLRILELLKKFNERLKPAIQAHLEAISMLCFTPAFAGESAEDAFDRVRICTALLSLYYYHYY